MSAIISGQLLLADNDFGHMGDWGAGWWLLMVFGMVAFWGLVIVGIVWLVRSLGDHRPGRASDEPDALAVLDRRMAEGTISPEEYRERRALLSLSGRAAEHESG